MGRGARGEWVEGVDGVFEIPPIFTLTGITHAVYTARFNDCSKMLDREQAFITANHPNRELLILTQESSTDDQTPVPLDFEDNSVPESSSSKRTNTQPTSIAKTNRSTQK